MFSTLINSKQLNKIINSSNTLVFDCRYGLKNITTGQEEYFLAHIPGAIYLHMDKDLSGTIIAGKTGRHPLPELDELQSRFSKWGIDTEKQIVVYDNKKGALAARLWWMLRYVGHTKVAVLDGGWKAWKEAGFNTEVKENLPTMSAFTTNCQPSWVLDADEVDAVGIAEDWAIIDSRAAARYKGEIEPIDPIAGHIPEAINMPFTENWDDKGLMKTPMVLRQRFSDLPRAEHCVFYCGSGVTACHNILAHMHAGLGMARLYPGSWSEWVTKDEKIKITPKPKYAVIDCGTNTFHLLIVQAKKGGGFETIYRERRYIKLAEEGIQTIGHEAYQRAIEALKAYSEIIKDIKVVDTRVSGTAALRTASNGSQLVKEAEAVTGLKIDIIPGKEEAQLIYKGVEQAIGLQPRRWMIMDIGGGSVEFIIVDKQGVRWFESFPIGVAVIYKHFHQSEPITNEETNHLETFLGGQLVQLHAALLQYPTHHLIGAAGTFDVIGDVLGVKKNTSYATNVKLDGFQHFYTRLINATQQERLAMYDIPNDRADMIVVALILVKYIMNLAKIDQVTVSDFSMKEGMLSEMMKE